MLTEKDLYEELKPLIEEYNKTELQKIHSVSELLQNGETESKTEETLVTRFWLPVNFPKYGYIRCFEKIEDDEYSIIGYTIE